MQAAQALEPASLIALQLLKASGKVTRAQARKMCAIL